MNLKSTVVCTVKLEIINILLQHNQDNFSHISRGCFCLTATTALSSPCVLSPLLSPVSLSPSGDHLSSACLPAVGCQLWLMVERLILSGFDCQGLVICHPGEGETQSQFEPQNGFPGQRPSPWKQRAKWRLCRRIQSNDLPSVSVSQCPCVCVFVWR